MTEVDSPAGPAKTGPVTSSTIIKREDFPGLHRGSDDASRTAQRIYLSLQKLYLGSLVLGAVVGSLTSLGVTDCNAVLYPFSASLFGVGLLLLGVIRIRQDDKAWFDGRAIAESVKTATWRFMTKAPPFQADGDDPERRFVSELGEIRKARPNFGKRLAAVLDVNAKAITDTMRRTRGAALGERKRLYVEARLREQKAWYASKAQFNARNGSRWFAVTVVLQMVALEPIPKPL